MQAKKKILKTKKVVLLITPSREYSRGLLRGITKYARFQSDWVFHWPIEYRLAKFKQNALSVLKKIKPDGILMREPKNIMKIIEMGIPTVSFTYSRDRFPKIANVIIKNEEIGKMGAKHLLERGFRQFAYCGFDRWWWSRKRRQSFAKTVSDAGCETYFYKPRFSKAKIDWNKESRAIADWLTVLPKPIGLMACNDDCGQVIMEACKTVDMRIPDDVAIVGVDDDKLICDLSHPPLSSIALNVEKSGYDAAALLNKIMNGEKLEKSDLYIRPVRVVQRQSTDVLTIDDADVVEAIRYIRSHAANPICVNDVVNAVSLSRRVLEKRFREILKHSIHNEIRHTRIEKIIHLLTETQMSISQIAHTMGFPDAAHISRYFCKEKGVSLAAYRKLYI